MNPQEWQHKFLHEYFLISKNKLSLLIIDYSFLDPKGIILIITNEITENLKIWYCHRRNYNEKNTPFQVNFRKNRLDIYFR